MPLCRNAQANEPAVDPFDRHPSSVGRAVKRIMQCLPAHDRCLFITRTAMGVCKHRFNYAVAFRQLLRDVERFVFPIAYQLSQQSAFTIHPFDLIWRVD